MISLKNKKTKKNSIAAIAEPMHDDYPWGLEINLDDDSMKKLGIKATDYKSKDTFTIIAKVNVSETRTTERNGKVEQYLNLQITDIEMPGAKKSKGKAHMDTLNEGPGGAAD